MLDPNLALLQGTSPSHFLTGNGMKTVLMTMSYRERHEVPPSCSRIVTCEASIEFVPLVPGEENETYVGPASGGRRD